MCPSEEAVAAFLAGALPRDERARFELHVDTCGACQALIGALAKAAPRDGAIDPATSLGGSWTSDGPDDDAIEWRPGREVGRHVVLARIGAGGMGVVYSAYDPVLDRRVALKVLRDAGARDRLHDEARIAARLSHPNVVAVHDVVEAGDAVCVAMEHVDGVTLRAWLRDDRTPAAIVEVFAQAGRGLAAAHDAGLVHRDFKPSNVMIDRSGRARVLDFGLAREASGGGNGEIAGTPAYMAPEQRRGDAVDARADQYAFAVSLREALATAAVSDRITRALRRATDADPAARFPSMASLLAELAPPRRRGRRWIAAGFVAGGAIAAVAVLALRRAPAAPSCVASGAAIDAVWGPAQADALRRSFHATGVSYADRVAADTVRRLDDWAARWRASSRASCRATVIDRRQPAATDALRQACLDELAVRLRPVVALAAAADPSLVARADQLVDGLPAPERCDDTAALSAMMPPPPAEAARAELDAVRAAIAETDALILAARFDAARAGLAEVERRAAVLAYPPLDARVQFLAAQLAMSSGQRDRSLAELHAAARAATAARDPELLARIWIALTKSLGNDLRTLDDAAVFDGYVAALLPQLRTRDTLAFELEWARCNRNINQITHDAATLEGHCRQVIALAATFQPPRVQIALAAAVRLGHFQRLQGHKDAAVATLTQAVADSVRVRGDDHPDTAMARYSLGIAAIDTGDLARGLDELRHALVTRQAAFPGGSTIVAESMMGLGDALGTSGDHAAAVAQLEQALAMMDQFGAGESAQAANARILIGLSLEELHRTADASAHYLRAADIADRVLEHAETLAATGLELAANIARKERHPEVAAGQLQRAIRMLERAKADPAEVARLQAELGAVGDPRPR